LNTEEESQQSLKELRDMYSKLKNKDTTPLDDLVNKYEKSESSKKTKSGNIAASKGNEYIERYIVNVDPSGDHRKSAYEGVTYDYQGNVDYEGIISNPELSIEDKEMLIITFLSLDAVIEDIDYKINILNAAGSTSSTCLDTYRQELTRIRDHYLLVSVNAWGIFLSGQYAKAIITAAGILRDALSGKHYGEITVAEKAYNVCIGNTYEQPQPTKGDGGPLVIN
jgi:hypothetical protein